MCWPAGPYTRCHRNTDPILQPSHVCPPWCPWPGCSRCPPRCASRLLGPPARCRGPPARQENKVGYECTQKAQNEGLWHGCPAQPASTRQHTRSYGGPPMCARAHHQLPHGEAAQHSPAQPSPAQPSLQPLCHPPWWPPPRAPAAPAPRCPPQSFHTRGWAPPAALWARSAA